MIEVIENSLQRLRLRLGGWRVGAGVCTLDRETDIADFARLALHVPYRHRRVALGDVRSVVVKRRGRRKAYCPVVEVRIGEPISLGEYTKQDALEAARAIRDFLAAQGRGLPLEAGS
ncbi:MAG TPA: hypothetical protein VGC36_09890 [Rhizomicrobium sp.]